MLTEDYCDLKTAKLLKEKGFDEKTLSYYEDGILCHGDWFEWNRSPLGQIAAPSQSMAMKWLREMHKISIEITSKGYLIDNDVEWECDIKAGHRLYFRHITNEESFESCAEAAIKYCLENLI